MDILQSEVLPIVFAAIAFIGLITRAIKDFRLQAVPPKTPTSLEVRINELQAQMRSSALLIEQITAEMDAQAKTAAALKAEAEQAQQLASLHKDQQEAVMRALRSEMTAESKRTWKQGLRINILLFFAGVAGSIVVTLLIKPL